MKIKNKMLHLIAMLAVSLLNCVYADVIEASDDRRMIYVYAGPGASPVCVIQTITTLEKVVDPNLYTIERILPEAVIEGSWKDHTALFIIPGGGDLPYCQSLNGKGNANIREYVQDLGGKYLGICAGAYYASRYIDFKVNDYYAITGDRELAFFPGSAYGPILAPYNINTRCDGLAAKVTVELGNGPRDFELYYQGGGSFYEESSLDNVQVLGRFQSESLCAECVNQKDLEHLGAAIVECTIGKGKAILTYVHPEYDPYSFESLTPECKGHEQYEPVLEKLKASNDERLELMRTLIERLGIQTHIHSQTQTQ